MTATDTDALAERIYRETFEDRYPGHSWESVPEYVKEAHRAKYAAVLPIVAVEVRKAKAEALREAADRIDGEEPHHLGDSDLDPLDYNTLGEYGIDRAAEWLRTRATEYETGDQA